MAVRKAHLVRAGAAVGVTFAAAAFAWWALPTFAKIGGSQPGDVVPAPDTSVSMTGPSPEASEAAPVEDPERREFAALSGTLTRCADEYCVNGIPVDFGPPWYLDDADAPTDYDSDGAIEPLADEIAGLVDQDATFTVQYGRFGDVDVFAINGVFYRKELGPAPWATATPAAPRGPPAEVGPPWWSGGG